MNDIPKVVFSRTLRDASWPETRIARGDTALEIGRLKAEPGREIIAHGGTPRCSSAWSTGTASTWSRSRRARACRCSPRTRTPGRLRLEQSTAYPGGTLELVYVPA